MNSILPSKLIFISALLAAAMSAACSSTGGQMVAASSQGVSASEHTLSTEASILQTWSGDYPVSQLGRLPGGQVQSSVGFVGDKVTFAAVWEVFNPGENVPEVDFSKNIVVFTRNVDFYNHTNIIRVTLKDGVAEVLAMETMSARPIEDRVAMALAVIPRTGVKFIRAGAGQVAVRQK